MIRPARLYPSPDATAASRSRCQAAEIHVLSLEFVQRPMAREILSACEKAVSTLMPSGMRIFVIRTDQGKFRCSISGRSYFSLYTPAQFRPIGTISKLLQILIPLRVRLPRISGAEVSVEH